MHCSSITQHHQQAKVFSAAPRGTKYRQCISLNFSFPGCRSRENCHLYIYIYTNSHKDIVAQLVGACPVEKEAALEGAPLAAFWTPNERKLGRHWLGLNKALVSKEAHDGNVLIYGHEGKAMGLAPPQCICGGVGESPLIAVDVGIGAQHWVIPVRGSSEAEESSSCLIGNGKGYIYTKDCVLLMVLLLDHGITSCPGV